jgi:hypothetical protein
MESTGYSLESLAAFEDPELQQKIQKEEARREWIEAQSKKELDRRNRCESERALGRKAAMHALQSRDTSLTRIGKSRQSGIAVVVTRSCRGI